MIKKSVSLCLSLVLLISICLCFPVTASANSRPVSYTSIAYIFPDTKKVSTTIALDITEYETISNLKSSSNQVKLSVNYNAYKSYIQATSTTFTGTTNISFKFKGKTYTVKYTVKKYTNPCKLFQIGSTRYTSKYNSKNALVSHKTKLNQTFNVTAKSGWTITSVRVKHYDAYHPEVKGTTIYYPNSSSFSTKVSLYYFGHCGGANDNSIRVIYKNKHTGQVIEQYFTL